MALSTADWGKLLLVAGLRIAFLLGIGVDCAGTRGQCADLRIERTYVKSLAEVMKVSPRQQPVTKAFSLVTAKSLILLQPPKNGAVRSASTGLL